MKKYIIKISLIMLPLGALLFNSCDGFLDEPPRNSLIGEDFYKTPNQAEQGLLGAYGSLRQLSDQEFLYLSEVRSDNVWVNPSTDGLRDYSEIGTFRAANNIATFNSAWNSWYKVIYDANMVIEAIPNIDFSATKPLYKEQILGEAHFLRGWAYFELARLFGNVPIVLTPLIPKELLNVPQSTAQQVYDQVILPDMIFAKANLPLGKYMKNDSNAAVKGRADKIAATAMLGRIYLTMAGFPINDPTKKALAEVELKQVIDFSAANSDQYWAPTLSEWQKQWMSENNNKYSIFAIQYRAGGSGNPAIFNFSPALPPSYTGKRIFSNAIYVERSLMYEFDKVHTGSGLKDGRGIGTSVLLGYAAEGSGDFKNGYSETKEDFVTPEGPTVQVNTNAMFYKFLNSKKKRAELVFQADIEGAMKDNYDWPVNLPIIRLEDVQLMYAEIIAEEGDDAGALAIVNKIRARAGCDDATGDAAAAIKRERRLELMGEGIRWFDMVRQGEWKTATTAKFNLYNSPYTDVANLKEGRHLCPISLSQMNVKPGWYVQNPGY